MLDMVLGTGVPVELRGKTWNVLPIDVFDTIELVREMSLRHPGVQDPLSLFNRYNPEDALLLAWIALRKCDPNLTDEQRDNCTYTLTKAQVRSLFPMSVSDGVSNAAKLAKVIDASGMYPSADEEAQDEVKNDPAPAAIDASRRASGRPSKKAAPSSSSDADSQETKS